MSSPALGPSEASGAPERWLTPPPVRGIRAAFVFLTRIPVGGFPYRSEDWRWAGAHAPFVGIVIGGITGVVDRLLAPAGETAAAILAIGVSMLLTGAFHEDGLADTADALGGGTDRAKIFAILKDSRVGTFGAAALVVSIVARACLVAGLGDRAVVGLVVAGSIARVAPIWLMTSLPYVTDSSTSKSRGVLQCGLAQAVTATGWGVVLLALAVATHRITARSASALVLSTALVGLITGWRYRRRLGGITGDFLGATEQIAEITALVVISFGAHGP